MSNWMLVKPATFSLMLKIFAIAVVAICTPVGAYVLVDNYLREPLPAVRAPVYEQKPTQALETATATVQ